MGRSYKIILGALLALLAMLIFLEANQKDPVNWYPSYSITDKIPQGTFVFYESLEKVAKVEQVNIPPFEFLEDTSTTGTYFFLNASVGIDAAELNKLLKWVEKGNTAVISASYISYPLLDTLKITNDQKIRKNGLENIPQYNFANKDLRSEKYYEFNRDHTLEYFDSLNGKQQKVLGIAKVKDDNSLQNDSLANFVESKFGEGRFLLHSSPQAFTNYFLLDGENFEYAEKFLAYLDLQETIYWDNHYKNGKIIHTSPLYILLSNRYFKWAYYFVIIATILFIFFEGKRKQKSIPVVDPLRNQTYDYTRTIAGMYLDQKDYRTIAQKIRDHFFIFLQKEFKINVKEQKNYRQLIEQQTKISSEEIDLLFDQIKALEVKPSVTKKDIEALNRLIIQFKKNM
ncbi:DUF4350 domain-containing protein [Mesonia mobilis]|uniref:DUF4350 domain-containing protein n=1 Tax=Mesonia mobilis TaxID=369791 RepID=A0ABQ3BS97_9FLAO|nr:DUF4350 domain-containing protein [Mesonia mobilis]MBQ0737158.1 DUF4350 domain-containing protein [Aquimarina celericrescens]GGZ51630.1 hypothetical protein GCM10008088_11870 [Mesonia mobilis]